MRVFIGLALAALLVAAAPLNAQTVDFRTVKCQEIAALPLDSIDFVSVWLEGYSADEEDEESMQFDLSGTDAEDIKAFCEQHPEMGLLQAVDAMDSQPE